MPEKFSFFKKGITNKVPNGTVSLERAIDLIRGNDYREDIERLRAAADKTVRGVIKKNLHYFTFSGTFKKRLTEDLEVHSGLICMDFDEVDILKYKPKLSVDSYTAACFISPSGTGLKVIVRIHPERHLESFLWLENYYKETYDLSVDPSGKDVTRACFVSWDPDAVLIENSKPAPHQEPQEAKREMNEIYRPEKRDHQLEKNVRRIEYCLEQIERHKLDITSEYNDWLMIAFSLACLGEDGRAYFHRVSQFNAEYEEKDCNEKFDNALQKGRFKTPGKFFSLCKDYGVDTTLPRQIKPAGNEDDTPLLPDGANIEDYKQYGFWESNGVYQSVGMKGQVYEVSNFVMRILYHVATGKEEAYRLVEIKNIHGYTAVINLNTDDFESVASFRKVIARRGNFIFKGNDADLIRLKDKLQREERTTSMLETLGYNKRGNFYAFANGIVDCSTLDSFSGIDEYGIVQHQERNYFIPALSKIYSDKEYEFQSDRKFIFIPNEKITFQAWAEQFSEVYSKRGWMAIAFYVSCLYRDIIFKALGGRFPILNLYGKRGSGKGTLTQSLLKLFGEGQDQLMVSGVSTPKAFMVKFAQYYNSIVWLDEYKNNINRIFVESLKNVYDGIGYERRKKDHSFQNDYVPIWSGCLLSGQEMPTIEPALFTRVIMLSFSESKFSDDQKRQFRLLQRMEGKGLSALTVKLLGWRSDFEKKYKETFETTFDDFSAYVNNREIDDRMLVNYSAMISTVRILTEHQQLPFTVDEFRAFAKENLRDQFAVLAGSDDTSKFWEIIEFLFNRTEIHEEKDFIIKDGMLYIRLQNVYGLYAREMRQRNDPNMLAQQTLYHYLENDKAFLGKEKKSFGGAYTWCHRFKYADIGINLIKFESEEQRAMKLRDAGLEDEEYLDKLPF